MRRLVTIISVLAIANVIAFAGFVGWLASTDRLDRERVERIRKLLAITITAQRAAEAQGVMEAEAKALEETAAARLALPPVPASQVIAAGQQQQDAELQSDLRRQRELDDLRTSLLRLQASLEEREAALARKAEEFEETKRRYAEIEGADQFKTALVTLEAQKPKDAKSVLQALLAGGHDEQVVAYLAGMDEGKRAKVLGEFVKDAPAVAADLLERLRTRSAPPTGGARVPDETGKSSYGSNRGNQPTDRSSAGARRGEPGDTSPAVPPLAPPAGRAR